MVLDRDKIIEGILRDCFWEYDIDKSDVIKILNSNDRRALKKLFSKIIYNSSDKLLTLQIFSKEQLKEFFADFKATYNHSYIDRHVAVLKALLLDVKEPIKGLEWKKR